MLCRLPVREGVGDDGPPPLMLLVRRWYCCWRCCGRRHSPEGRGVKIISRKILGEARVRRRRRVPARFGSEVPSSTNLFPIGVTRDRRNSPLVRHKFEPFVSFSG